MDLSYSKEEVAFRQEVRDFFATAVPPETRKKLQEGRHLSTQDVVTWQQILNKKGWHFPQMRFESLWEDVDDYIFPVNPGKPPEPLFMRANSNDCIELWLTNLVPKEYLLDDFQVRTPTDILGQHIHLVKFDVLASDGSANGWNDEDGTFSPEEVRERIAAIRAQNGCTSSDLRNGTFVQ